MEKGFSFILEFHHRHLRGVGDSLMKLDTNMHARTHSVREREQRHCNVTYKP